MKALPARFFAFGLLSPFVATADEDCPKHFREYGFFLQAKRSCGKEIEYPLLKLMKECAKQTSQEVALTLMDDGRREWARNLMRSNLGSMCDDAFSKLPAASKPRKGR